MSNTTYSESEIASQDTLHLLPEFCLAIWEQYLQGALPEVSQEEVKEILQAWYDGDTNKLTTPPSSSHVGLEKCRADKRRRVDGDV